VDSGSLRGFLGQFADQRHVSRGMDGQHYKCCSNDGFAIEWIASSASSDLEPGQSTSQFSFVTSDPPSSVFGNSVFYPGIPVMTSVVYSGMPFSDPGVQFVVEPRQAPTSDNLLFQNTNGQASIWEMNGNTLIGGGPVIPNPGPSWHAIGTGDFNDDGHSDILWQNTSTGQASIWDMSGTSLVGGGPVSPNPGPSWRAVGFT
jgi:hypothetical protein